MGVVRDSKFRISAPGLERKAKVGETFQLGPAGLSLGLLSLVRDRAIEQDIWRLCCFKAKAWR